MIRYAEFCAGVGGFRLGIEQSKLDAVPVYANEINDSCELTYSENFRETVTQHFVSNDTEHFKESALFIWNVHRYQ